jgi:hypothetical protein
VGAGPLTHIYGRHDPWHYDHVPKKNKSQVSQPVTTTQQPWVRCEQCGNEVFYQPGKGAAAAALTTHYNKEHVAELASA